MNTQKIILSNKILVKGPVLYIKELQRSFSLINPKYTNSCRYGNSRFKPKKYLFYYEDTKEGVYVPRGSLTKLQTFYKERKTELKIIDKTILHNEVLWSFKGELKKDKGQLQIKKFRKNFGIVKAPTGAGKTVLFLWLMAQFGQPTIIVVHTNLLLKQWPERIEQFLGIKDVGIIGNGKMNIKPVTIALMQTLVKHTHLLDSFGCMCVDEVHRAAAYTYTRIIENYKGRYLVGLSATPSRRDGLTNVMKWHLGGIHVSIDLKSANLCDCYYQTVLSDFKAENCFKQRYSTALVELTRNQKRNKTIIKNVLKYIEHPGIHLILSQNRSHCTKLFKLLPKHIQLIGVVLTGKVNKKERELIIQKAKTNKLKFIFATDKLIGEGFDEPLLSVLHLTTPISDKNRLIQYVGRIRRQYKGKEYGIVFDYFDFNEPVLRGGARNRITAYTQNNIKKLEDK